MSAAGLAFDFLDLLLEEAKAPLLIPPSNLPPPEEIMANDIDSPEAHDSTQKWIIAGLTAIFVALYAAALFGWIVPLKDDSVVERVEAIVAVIIGYFFGRIPGEKNERTLKDEIRRQTEKTRTAEEGKEQAQDAKSRAEQKKVEAEQKVKHTRAALAGIAPDFSPPKLTFDRSEAAPSVNDTSLRHSVAAAIRILDSAPGDAHPSID